ncbi:MAG: UTP--glucose-1-phosphate uridylyltransferase, partial [Candidatus Omnitrophica bacterium]|nr:UTP--glucose-1-phosphate uridylyltransferase [Candidatus Omnitrophota bacterium]
RYLIKSGILELAVQKSEDKRQGFVRSEIHRLKSKYSLAKDVIFELSRLSHIWDISFSDKLEIAISNLSFSESKEKKDEYLTKLKRWQRDYEEGKIFKNFATFYYIIQYTFLPLSEMAARFDINKDEKIDGFIKVLDEQTQFIQNLHKQIGNISYSDIFIYAILEHIIPSIAGNTKTFKAYADKLKVLQEFIFRITYLNNYSYVCSLLEDSVPLVAAKISKVDLFREVLGELNKFLEIGGKLTAAESYLGKARIVEDILPIMINLFEGDKEKLHNVLEQLRDFISDKFKQGQELEAFFILRLLSVLIGRKIVNSPEEFNTLLNVFSQFVSEVRIHKPQLDLFFTLSFIHRIITGPQTLMVNNVKNIIDSLKDVIINIDHFEQVYDENGRIYVLPASLCCQIEKEFQEKGRLEGVLPDANNRKEPRIDKKISQGILDAAHFEYTEKENLEKILKEIDRKGVKKYFKKVNCLSNVQQITPLDSKDENYCDYENIVRQKGRKQQLRERGIEILHNGQFAYGFTAGLLSSKAKGVFGTDFTLTIKDVVEEGKTFLWFKFFIAEKANRIYHLQIPMPVVIMSGFKRGIVDTMLLENRYFGYPRAQCYIFSQGVQKIIDVRGQVLKIEREEVFNTPGAFDFIKQLILSGTLAELFNKGVRYLMHSNINNPIAVIDPAMVALFEEINNQRKKVSRKEYVVVIEFGDYREERGGFGVKVKCSNRKEVLRVLHEDRIPEIYKSSAKGRKNYSLANWMISLEGLLNFLPEKKKYLLHLDHNGTFSWGSSWKELQKLAEFIDRKYMEKGKPLLRNKSISFVSAKGKALIAKGYAIDRPLDDITAMVPWLGMYVNRDERFVSIKDLIEADRPDNKFIISNVTRNLKITEFKERNRIVDILKKEGVLSDTEGETVKSLRDKIIWMLVPSRTIGKDVDREDSLVVSYYIPGAYRQERINTDERNRNNVHRKKLIDAEVTRLVAIHSDKFSHSKNVKRSLIEKIQILLEAALEMETEKGKLLDGLTNAQSNMLVRQCIKIVLLNDPYSGDYNPYERDSDLVNRFALNMLAVKSPKSFDFEKFLLEIVASVQMKFMAEKGEISSDRASFEKAEKKVKVFMEGGKFTIDYTKKYRKEVLSSKTLKIITYFSDDNGEICYILYFIQKQLCMNKMLKFNLVPRNGQHGFDASYEDVRRLLMNPLFKQLEKFERQGRFRLIQDSPKLGGIDLSRVSKEVKEAIKGSDVLFSIGEMNFEMLNGITKDAYHLFMVHSATCSEITGLPRENFIFVHLPAEAKYFQYSAKAEGRFTLLDYLKKRNTSVSSPLLAYGIDSSSSALETEYANRASEVESKFKEIFLRLRDEKEFMCVRIKEIDNVIERSKRLIKEDIFDYSREREGLEYVIKVMKGERVLLKRRKEKKKGILLIPQAILLQPDKDRTMTEAGQPFPIERAKQIIMALYLGVNENNVLSGAIAADLIRTLFESLLEVLVEMDMPAIAKWVVYKKMIGLSEDGGTRITVELKEAWREIKEKKNKELGLLYKGLKKIEQEIAELNNELGMDGWSKEEKWKELLRRRFEVRVAIEESELKKENHLGGYRFEVNEHLNTNSKGIEQIRLFDEQERRILADICMQEYFVELLDLSTTQKILGIDREEADRAGDFVRDKLVVSDRFLKEREGDYSQRIINMRDILKNMLENLNEENMPVKEYEVLQKLLKKCRHALELVRFKDSQKNFFSISCDELGVQAEFDAHLEVWRTVLIKDEQFFQKNLFGKIAERMEKELSRRELGKNLFFRAGTGYVNITLTNKSSQIEKTLYCNRSKGKLVVTIGDSKSDVGNCADKVEGVFRLMAFVLEWRKYLNSKEHLKFKQEGVLEFEYYGSGAEGGKLEERGQAVFYALLEALMMLSQEAREFKSEKEIVGALIEKISLLPAHVGIVGYKPLLRDNRGMSASPVNTKAREWIKDIVVRANKEKVVMRIGMVIGSGKEKIIKVEDGELVGEYKNKLKEITGVIGHRIHGPPVKLRVDVGRDLKDKGDSAYSYRYNSQEEVHQIYIHPVILTKNISDSYRKMIGEVISYQINRPRADKQDVVDFYRNYLYSHGEVVDEYINENRYIENELVREVELEREYDQAQKELTIGEADKGLEKIEVELAGEFYELGRNALYKDRDYML